MGHYTRSMADDRPLTFCVTSHPHRPQLVDEVFGVITLVSRERDPLGPVGARLDHMQRGDALSVAVRRRQAGVDITNYVYAQGWRIR